jgi:hypothetical protein
MVDRSPQKRSIHVLDLAEVADVADLLPVARAAHAELTAEGRAFTRTALTERLRGAGHPAD